ncbi:hypothetical protein ACTD5D_39765 [Nocardia takedensis]|uniref:hypothetical protein n=1 Tax=Nocardia takedensis TaxID=259390 RepID=UPI003F776298
MPKENRSINLDDEREYDPADYDANPDNAVAVYSNRVDDVDDRGHFDDERGKPYVARPNAETGRHDDERATRRRGPVPRASRIPANAPRPRDHQPKREKRDKPAKRAARAALEREAEGIETVVVAFDGEEYEIPADPLDWDLAVTEAFELGRVITAVRGLLGPRQFAKVSRKRYTNRQFSELFDLLAQAGGFDDAGN